MKTIEIELTGTAPLLMHNPAAMNESNVKSNPAKQYDAKIDAEKAAYRNEKEELFVPARCLKAAIINAASWYKFGKKNAKPVIAGCIRIEPGELVILNQKDNSVKDYRIDLRPVVVNRARIMRARPCFDDWKLKFNIVYNDQMVQDTKIIKEIVDEAGHRVGILDNRPQKYGENGTFVVTEWKEE